MELIYDEEKCECRNLLGNEQKNKRILKMDFDNKIQIGRYKMEILGKPINRVELLVKQFVNCKEKCKKGFCKCRSKINFICAKLIIDFLDGANEYICKIIIPTKDYFKHNELYKEDKYNYFFEYANTKKKLEAGNKYYLSACRYENGINTNYKKNNDYILCFPPEKRQYIFEISVENIMYDVDQQTATLYKPEIWYSITSIGSRAIAVQPEINVNVLSLCIKKSQLFVGSKSFPHYNKYFARINKNINFKDCEVSYSNNCWYINDYLIPIDINHKIIILNSKKKYKLDGITLRFL